MEIDTGNKNSKQATCRADRQLASGAVTFNQERSKLVIFLGKVLIFITVTSLIFVGLLINLLQLVLLLTFKLSNRPWWRRWHKKINGYLIYSLFSPVISLLYCWSNVDVNIQLADMKLIEDAKRPMIGLIIPNHSFELDFMISFILAYQLGNVGSYKSFSKDEIKYVPVFGWCLWMADIIFVKRNWHLDKFGLSDKLNRLFDYEQCLLGLFAEGTRWTAEKHQASMEFAESRGLRPLKYHLIPRSRGFCHTVRHYLREVTLEKRMDPKLFRIFNLQIMMPDKPKFRDFMEGRQIRGDVYCEEVFLSQEIRDEVLNSNISDDGEIDCPKLKQLLYDIFYRKDQLVDEYKANGNKFMVASSQGGKFPFVHRKLPIIIWLAGLYFTISTLIYLTTFANSLVFWSLLISLATGCVFMVKKIAQMSRAMNFPIGRQQLTHCHHPKKTPDFNGDKQYSCASPAY